MKFPVPEVVSETFDRALEPSAFSRVILPLLPVVVKLMLAAEVRAPASKILPADAKVKEHGR